MGLVFVGLPAARHLFVRPGQCLGLLRSPLNADPRQRPSRAPLARPACSQAVGKCPFMVHLPPCFHTCVLWVGGGAVEMAPRRPTGRCLVFPQRGPLGAFGETVSQKLLRASVPELLAVD